MGVRSHAKGTFLAEVEPGQQIEEKELSKVRANNLVVNIVFAWEHAVAITSEDDAKALVSHRFPQCSFHDDMEPGFFRYATLDEDFRRHLWLASPSGAGRNKTLNIGTMLEYEFTLPSRKEQTEISKLVDHRDEEGQFILTGSAVPPTAREIHHTGTGRFSWLTMRPMSLWESGDSNGKVSFGELFHQPEKIWSENELSLADVAFLACRGGWPRATMQKKEVALGRAFDYFDAVIKNDISRVDGVKRDAERTRRIMRSYARHQGTQTPISVIANDIRTNDLDTVDDKTVYSYISALKKIFVIEDMGAWNPNLRSKTAIRTSDNRYFVDPSIATAALGLGPDDLINDLNTFGLIFETLCVRDLRVFADALDGQVFHYRDKNGLECDAVVHLRNGSYGLIEIKLGGDKLINDGIEALKNLTDKIDTTRMKEPSFRMILTAVGKFAYRQEDGIYIVPIGCLKE